MSAAENYSLILMLLTALAAGLVGSFALMKRMSLAGDVVSHIALPGLGLALLVHINPLIGAAAALFLGTILIWHLQKGGTLTTDVAIGVIFTAALAIGTLVTPSEDLIEALFGAEDRRRVARQRALEARRSIVRRHGALDVRRR